MSPYKRALVAHMRSYHSLRARGTCLRHGVSAGTPLSPLQSLSRWLYQKSLAFIDTGSQSGLPMTLLGLSNLSSARTDAWAI